MGTLASFFTLLAPIVTEANMPHLDVVVGNLMKWMNSGIMNLGWTVVVFTLLLKLITFPLDFFSRRSMKVYSLKMEKIQPQLQKIEKQYANNKQLLQQKKMAVQKKMGASALASCLPSIVTMVLFFYVFSAFTSYINYSSVETFNTLVQVYQDKLEENGVTMNRDDKGKVTQYDPDQAEAVLTKNDGEVQKIIDEALRAKYKTMHRSFLWVKNVGLADVPWLKPIAETKTSYFNGVKDVNIDDKVYEAVMKPVIESYRKTDGKLMVNGFLILPILAVGVSVLSQLVTQKTQKGAQAMNGNQGKTMMKVMMFIFPIMFLTFSLTSSTAFTIYMTVNSIITVLTTLLINFIVEHTVKLKEKKQAPKGVGYRR